DGGQARVMESDGLAQLFDGEGRVSVHAAIAGGVRAARGLHDVGRRGELRHHSVNRMAFGRPHSSSTSACGRMVRISKIEITGRKRMNRKSSARNKPSVPTKVMMSHLVAWNIPQDDGRKSRCKLVTMMMKRSSHMPTFTTMATIHNPSGLLRTWRAHSTCGKT